MDTSYNGANTEANFYNKKAVTYLGGRPLGHATVWMTFPRIFLLSRYMVVAAWVTD